MLVKITKVKKQIDTLDQPTRKKHFGAVGFFIGTLLALIFGTN